MGYEVPQEGDLQSSESFSNYVASHQKYLSGAPRTTASISGTPQYAATSFSVSDVLQGTFNVKNPQDTLMVVNKALTQDLSGLYNLGGEGLSSFGSAPPAPAITGEDSITDALGNIIDTAGNVVDAAGNIIAGIISKDFVEKLPLEHPTTGAILWVRSGKGSSEMHLPTSPDINTDIAQHKQYPELPPAARHPWNMDRQGGAVGGEGDFSKLTPENSPSRLGDNANSPGQSGAFGIMDPTEEQFYISMAWPYKGDVPSRFRKAGREDIAAKAEQINKSAYEHKRVLVYSVATQKACVCVPGDWGPHPYFSNGAVKRDSIFGSYMGLAPDVHHVLGTSHGSEFIIGWMPDETPPGPYNPQPTTVGGAVVGAVGGIIDILNGGTTDATGGGGQNTIEELKYAGNLILNHPNCWLGKDGNRPGGMNAASGFRRLMTEGGSGGNAQLIVYQEGGKQFLVPALLNYLYYILQGGFILDGYLGAIVNKKKLGDGKSVSNHAHGGGIDIGACGIASTGKVYPFTNLQEGRGVFDQMFEYLASLPRSTKPEEVGCSYEFNYSNGFRVYRDPNPTHLHLGFDLTESGSLIPALKKNSAPRPRVN